MNAKRNQGIHLIKFLKVKGKLASLAVLEYPPDKRHLSREAFFILGNAKELTLAEIKKHRASSIVYSIDKDGRTGTVLDVFTHPKFGRTGLAKSLFGYAFREMLEHKATKAYIDWDGKDERARELYLSVGFGFVDDEERSMSLELESATVHALCVKSEWEKANA